MEWTDLFSNLLYFLTNSQMDVGQKWGTNGVIFSNTWAIHFRCRPISKPWTNLARHEASATYSASNFIKPKQRVDMFLNPRNPLWPVDLGCWPVAGNLQILSGESLCAKDIRSYSLANCQQRPVNHKCSRVPLPATLTSSTSSRLAFVAQLNTFPANQLASCGEKQPLPLPASSMRERSRITTSSSPFWSMRNFNSLSGDQHLPMATNFNPNWHLGKFGTTRQECHQISSERCEAKSMFRCILRKVGVDAQNW